MSENSKIRPAGLPADKADAADDQRHNDLAGADDHEAGAEEVVGPEDESRAARKREPSAAQKVKDEFPKP